MVDVTKFSDGMLLNLITSESYEGEEIQEAALIEYRKRLKQSIEKGVIENGKN